MRKLILFIGLGSLLFLPGCENNCKGSEAPEIEFGLLIGGDVDVISHQTGFEVTSEWEGLGINIIMNKVYCNGTTRGPFEENYTIDVNGLMHRQAIGYWSFIMNNRNDYMDINFFCGGNEIGNYAASCDMLAPGNGGTGYLSFKIEIEWDYSKNNIFASKVTLQ
jgi:hypothetical protein